MKQYYPTHGLGMICGLFGKTRQAHYKQQRAGERQDMENGVILKRVEEIRKQMPRIGTRKLYFLLADILCQHGITIGRDSLFNLLADHGMLIRRRKRSKTRTTDSNHPFRRYPNLVRELVITRPDQLWVSDITYIALTGDFCYLSLITDAYSRKIVGHSLHPSLKKEGPLQALNSALANGDPSANRHLIHHSDRGLQYCSEAYTRLLNSSGITISMTEKGDPYENAIAERVNGILKAELGLDKTFKTYQDATAAVSNAVAVYNQQRPHGSCNYLTPEQAHLQRGLLPSRWRSGKRKPIVNPGQDQ
jgi:putative transposase